MVMLSAVAIKRAEIPIEVSLQAGVSWETHERARIISKSPYRSALKPLDEQIDDQVDRAGDQKQHGEIGAAHFGK
jgi:hypothetical protein